MIKKFSTLLAFGLAITLPSAFAASVPLAPGGSVTPGANSTTPGTLVYNSGVIAFNEGGGVSGTYDFVVDNVGGFLDFFYQISNTSTIDNFNEITLKNFTGATTSVGYLSPGFGGTVAPSSADRDLGGDTINFHFLGAGGGTITAGSTADYVEVDTTATSFSLSGQVGVVDGGTFNIPASAPMPLGPAPEPMSMTLLGGGLALLGLARWRRPAKKA